MLIKNKTDRNKSKLKKIGKKGKLDLFMEGKRVEMYYCHSVFSRKSKFGDLNCNSVLETAKTKERKKERKKYSLTTADLNIQTLSISPPLLFFFKLP